MSGITIENRHIYKGPGVYVGRGTPLGNKYSHQDIPGVIIVDTRDKAVIQYAKHFPELLKSSQPAMDMFRSLMRQYVDTRKVALICSCAPARCHAEVIRASMLAVSEDMLSSLFHPEGQVADKVKYVVARLKDNPSGHTCHWPNCGKEVPPSAWGCPRHWRTLPQHIRNAIWAAYRPGQEISKTPSREYVGAANAAQEWIKSYLLTRQGLFG